MSKPRITKAMVEAASEAYASERCPSRWDGKPWGQAGIENHRRAIRAAIKTAFKFKAEVRVRSKVATVTNPWGDTFQTHVCNRGEDAIATTFGTFQKDSAGVFRWVRDHRFTLALPKS